MKRSTKRKISEIAQTMSIICFTLGCVIGLFANLRHYNLTGYQILKQHLTTDVLVPLIFFILSLLAFMVYYKTADVAYDFTHSSKSSNVKTRTSKDTRNYMNGVSKHTNYFHSNMINTHKNNNREVRTKRDEKNRNRH